MAETIDPKQATVEERFKNCDIELNEVLNKWGIGIVLTMNYLPNKTEPKIDYFDKWELEAKEKARAEAASATASEGEPAPAGVTGGNEIKAAEGNENVGKIDPNA